MNEFSREALLNIIETDHVQCGEASALARMALAAMDSEPVADDGIYRPGDAVGVFNVGCETCPDHLVAWTVKGQNLPAGNYWLYISQQPASVVPDEAQSREAFEKWCSVNIERNKWHPEFYAHLPAREQWSAWEACRVAMLQGADGKPELAVWYGAMPETNGKTNWTAMLHRKVQHPWEGITIDRSEYPDRVRYEADRMRHLIGELADEPDILAYDAEAHSGYVYPGNSPVIPDTWIPVSERMPEDEQEVIVQTHSGWRYVSFYDAHSRLFFDSPDGDIEHILVTHWMPLPAGPQEVKGE